MSAPRRKGLGLLLLAVWLLGSACGGDGGTDVNVDADFVGNWVAISFVLDGEELITAGSSFNASVGFFSDGSYQLIAGGDDDGVICIGSTSCVESGDFSYTGTYITLDPGTMDELIFAYSVSGDMLTIEGDSSLGPYTAIFERI